MMAFSRVRWAQLAGLAVLVAGLVVLVIWRAPDLRVVGYAFAAVSWEWVAAAVGINLLSVVVRSVAWKIVIDQAMQPPTPRHRAVFSSFCVGLLANAALPGRVGELARVAVLSRRMRRPGAWATVAGTVFAHRLLDVVVSVALVVYVLYAARIPDWAVPGLGIVLGIGLGLLVAGLLLARRHHRSLADEIGPIRRLLRMARYGLAVFHRPAPAVAALCFQLAGWTAQVFAVWASFRAFGIDAPVSAAALVLVLVNLATVFPLWPGSVGLLQAAVAFPLLSYGVAYHHGFAFGIGLQAIEMSVGVGLGALFLAREGFSFAALRRMPEVTEVELDERVERIA